MYTAPPPYQPPPPTVYSQPPPPPAYASTPYLPPPRPAFQPAFMLGVRFGQLNPGGDIGKDANSGSSIEMSQYATSGWSFEGDLGLHLSPAWTFYGFWEYGRLGRADTTRQPDQPTTNAVGIGLNANTSPNSPVGFVFDIALGYRWMALSQSVSALDATGNVVTAKENFVLSGVMPLRVGLGLAIAPTRKMRIDLMGQFALGTFSQQTGGSACPNGCELTDSQQSSHYFAGLTAGARWDL